MNIHHIRNATIVLEYAGKRELYHPLDLGSVYLLPRDKTNIIL